MARICENIDHVGSQQASLDYKEVNDINIVSYSNA